MTLTLSVMMTPIWLDFERAPLPCHVLPALACQSLVMRFLGRRAW